MASRDILLEQPINDGFPLLGGLVVSSSEHGLKILSPFSLQQFLPKLVVHSLVVNDSLQFQAVGVASTVLSRACQPVETRTIAKRGLSILVQKFLHVKP